MHIIHDLIGKSRINFKKNAIKIMKSDYTMTMKHIINENIKRYVPHALNVGINLQNTELLCVI